MIYLNERFVDERDAKVSILDRGFNYGDGLFETIRIRNGAPLRWERHWARLQGGADFLGICVPLDAEQVEKAVATLVEQNKEGLLKIVLSRGAGERGYSPRGANKPTFVMSTHPAPPPVQGHKVIAASVRLHSSDVLLRYKTCNKLLNILARREADTAGADEALLLNEREEVVSATAANVFWIMGDRILTSPVEAGALPGITREVVFEICRASGVECAEARLPANNLGKVDDFFLTSVGAGISPVIVVNERPVNVPDVVKNLQREYAGLY